MGEQRSSRRAGGRQQNAAASENLAAAGKEPCKDCGVKARHGRFARCRSCLVKVGAKTCSRCGRLFMPDPKSAALRGKHAPKRRCAACTRKPRSPGKSVYVIGQAGAPGLGRRA